jgi:osmotically-inducible protein OsmY
MSGRIARVALRCVCLGLTGLGAGCGKQDADRLAGVCRLATAKLDGVTGGARAKFSNGWQAVRGSLSATTLDSRVATRLRWDQALADADLQVSSPSPGVVQLEGLVADLTQRRRAVDLAGSTQGVSKVLDKLTVGQPAAP